MGSRNRFRTISLMVAAGIILPGLSLTAATASTAGIEIRLWSSATVTDPQVKLGQIATITGEETVAASLKNLVLATQAADNRKLTVRAWQVAGQIGDAGFDAGGISITGAAGCQINFVSAADKKSEGPGLRVDQAARQAPPASLEGRLREIVCRNLTGKGLPKEHEVKITFNPGLRELLALSSPSYEFDITPQRSSNWLGLVAFKVKVFRDGHEIQALPILGEVGVRMPLFVAARTINSKARIGKTDIEKNWREITSLKDKYLTDAGDILDQQAKMIPAGTVITGDQLEPLPMVKRGQLVTVVYRRGGLDIRTVGKSMQSAFKNEVIQVRNERSKEIFRARVTGPGQVCVEGNLVPGGSEGFGMTNGSNP